MGLAALPCLLLSGLILNLIQLIVYVIIRPVSQQLHREVNHYLQYSYWSQTVAVADWNSNLKCRIYYKDELAYREFGSKSGIVIANHRYDIDWLAAWMLSEKLGTLGSDKAMLKSSLRHVPVIGWGWALSDMIFLSRNWQKDRENLQKSMDILLTYPRSLILAFFEGTRFTKTKYEASLKFAEERELNLHLKHHLIPRHRGFNCMVQRVRETMKKDSKLEFGLYNMQVAVDNDDNSRASLGAVLNGTKSCVHIYVESLDIKKVPVEKEEETTRYLYQIYEGKDELHDYFKENGKFPGIEKPYRPRWQSLVNWLTWMLVIYSALIYAYYWCFTCGSLLSIILASTFALSGLFSIRILINSTKVSKSSAYGTTTTTAATTTSSTTAKNK